MKECQVVELMAAAKPLIDSLKDSSLRRMPTNNEWKVFENVELALQRVQVNRELLSQAGWTGTDLAFFYNTLFYFNRGQ